MSKQNEIRLELHDEKSSKQYTVWLEKTGTGYDLWTAWGRISDKTPETKKKNSKPLELEKAQEDYAKVVKEKMKKGYQLVKGKLPGFIGDSSQEGKAKKEKPISHPKPSKKQGRDHFEIVGDISGGYRKDGGGIFIFLFDKKVNRAAIDSLTDSIYTETWEDDESGEEMGVSEYDPSLYQSNIAGDLEDEINYQELVRKIKLGETPAEKIRLFIDEVISSDYELILVDDKKMIIQKVNNYSEIEERISLIGKNLIIFIREFDSPEDY